MKSKSKRKKTLLKRDFLCLYSSSKRTNVAFQNHVLRYSILCTVTSLLLISFCLFCQLRQVSCTDAWHPTADCDRERSGSFSSRDSRDLLMTDTCPAGGTSRPVDTPNLNWEGWEIWLYRRLCCLAGVWKMAIVALLFGRGFFLKT